MELHGATGLQLPHADCLDLTDACGHCQQAWLNLPCIFSYLPDMIPAYV
jgi:hypothetical protein